MSYPYAKFHTPNCCGSVVPSVKQTGKYILPLPLYAAAIVVLCSAKILP
jgi:hypothetical protein